MNDMSSTVALTQDLSLLIVDSEKMFKTRFAPYMEQCGYKVEMVRTVREGRAIIEKQPPAFAVIDLMLDDGDGLHVLAALMQERRDARALIVTNYGSFSTALAAGRLGARNYLPKTSDMKLIERSLHGDGGPLLFSPSFQPMTPDRVRWEYIHSTFEYYGRNVSETARQLSMHRRTLQRMLAKHAPH
jgi:two-component system, response regulator RegA